MINLLSQHTETQFSSPNPSFSRSWLWFPLSVSPVSAHGLTCCSSCCAPDLSLTAAPLSEILLFWSCPSVERWVSDFVQSVVLSVNSFLSLLVWCWPLFDEEDLWARWCQFGAHSLLNHILLQHPPASSSSDTFLVPVPEDRKMNLVVMVNTKQVVKLFDLSIVIIVE